MATSNSSPDPQPSGPEPGPRLPNSIWGLLAAYVGAATLAIVKLQELNALLSKFPVWIQIIVVLAIFAPLLYTIRTWLKQRRKKRPSEISGELKPGYFSLAPREDAASFTPRADGQHDKILLWLEQSPGPLLYLTGVSGSGKTSLLAASVLPELRKKNIKTVRLRGRQDPLAELERKLQEPGIIWDIPPKAPGEIRTLLERACRHKRQQLLIVLDQFEEFLILKENNPKQKERLRQFFSSFVQAPIEGVTFLLVFRTDYSDYIGPFDDLGLPKLLQDHNWKEVPRFSERMAMDFIEHSGINVDKKLLHDVLREAAELEQTKSKGWIRPVTINLCGLVLGRFDDTLPRDFRPGKMIRGFLEEPFMHPQMGNAAGRLIRCFITNYVTKRPRTLTELVGETGLKLDEVQHCLRVLGLNEGVIVRPLDAAQEIWEISHDFLVPVLDSIAASTDVSIGRRSRPWLPWISAAVMALAVVLLPNLRQDPTSVLRSLGWTVTETNTGLHLEVAGIPRKGSLDALRRVRKPITMRLDTLDPSISEWRVLQNLTSLDLSHTAVSDIGPVAELRTLTALNLSRTNVSDIGALKSLKNLTSLDLNNTSVSNLGPLTELKNLTSLNLDNTRVTDLGPLQNLHDLTILSLFSTRISDIAPMADLKNLMSLNLWETSVSNLEPLRNLEELTDLNLSYTAVRDVEPLRSLEKLTNLNLAYTAVRDADPLKNLKKLTSLNLSHTQVKRMGSLEKLEDLTSLEVDNSKVVDVTPLWNLRKLTSLDLSNTGVSNVRVLQSLENLITLSLSHTGIHDAGPLHKLSRLSSLNLSYTRVSDVQPLGKLTGLTDLDLTHTKVEIVQALKALKKLRIVRLCGTQVSNASCDELRSAIQDRDKGRDLEIPECKEGHKITPHTAPKYSSPG